jgi:hypothetical protein
MKEYAKGKSQSYTAPDVVLLCFPVDLSGGLTKIGKEVSSLVHQTPKSRLRSSAVAPRNAPTNSVLTRSSDRSRWYHGGPQAGLVLTIGLHETINDVRGK